VTYGIVDMGEVYLPTLRILTRLAPCGFDCRAKGPKIVN